MRIGPEAKKNGNVGTLLVLSMSTSRCSLCELHALNVIVVFSPKSEAYRTQSGPGYSSTLGLGPPRHCD